MSSWIDKIGLD